MKAKTIDFEINNNVSFFPIPQPQSWDEVAHAFAEIIAEKFPEAQEVRFEGYNTCLHNSIAFGFEGYTEDEEFDLNSELLQLWADFDVSAFE